ncbi:hypothetical protein [Dictyobacter kobayashii]|uniref:Uncharacterized protein n=1 Tax=Dictyobacter kobayashii TaxID=2014872 RepID=A0A402AJR6_9CHLR|nr:hypothetical protein [Dictyobacter kobayashii]GCE19305.1 hypothetical protein KDK_31050 [Dictyobacter kobayashii]
MTPNVDAVILVGVFIIGIIVLILLLIFYKEARIRSRWRLIWTLVASVLDFLVLIAAEGLVMIQHLPSSVEPAVTDYYLGIPLCLYGFVVAVLAFL